MKVTVAVPAAHDAEVEPFVHAPPIVQLSDPKDMKEDALEMFTSPVIVTVPDVLRSAPPAIVSVPLTVRALVPFVSEPALRFKVEAVTCEDWEIVPVTVSVAKLWPARNDTVFEEPDRVIVEVPWVNVEPAPEVSQFPDTDHAPLVRVIVPDVPPVIVTLRTDTVEVFAVSTPPLPTVRLPPVRGLPDAGWNVTLFVNSCVSAPNVIVWELVELKVIAAAKDHEPEVEAFVHEPPTVHVPAPDVM